MYPQTVHQESKQDVPDEVIELFLEEAFAIPENRRFIKRNVPTIDIVSAGEGFDIHTEASAVDIFMPIFKHFGFHLMSYDMTEKDKATIIQYGNTGIVSVDLNNIHGTFSLEDAVEMYRLPVYDSHSWA